MSADPIAAAAREHGWTVKRLPASRKRPTPVLVLTKTIPNNPEGFHRVVTLSVRVTRDDFGVLATLHTGRFNTGQALRSEEDVIRYLATSKPAAEGRAS